MVLMHHNIPHDTLQAGNVVDIEWSDSRRVDCVLFRCTTILHYVLQAGITQNYNG